MQNYWNKPLPNIYSQDAHNPIHTISQQLICI